MEDIFENLMSGAFSSGKQQAGYTEEEIKEARKLQKKNGGTIMDNLKAVTGRSSRTSYDIDKEIQQLQQNLLNDFGMNQEELLENYRRAGESSGIDPSLMLSGSQSLGEMPSGSAFSYDRKTTGTFVPADISAFDGLEEKVQETIFGQEAFVKKLAIAFKRPFVMPEKKGYPRNAFFVSGAEDTGKHTALKTMTKELAERRLLSDGGIQTVDLSLYPSAGSDKVFLQDLYMALQSKENVILFENFDVCHISYLSYINELITTGKCMLSERYILQKGQLVSVNNSFASETVSSFTAAGKYLVIISTKPVSKLADALGAPFVNALGDICETAALDKDSLEKISRVKFEKLKTKAKELLGFTVTGDEEAFITYSLTKAEKGAACTGILTFYDDVLKALAELRLSGAYPKEADLAFTVDGNDLKVVIGEEETVLLSVLKTGYRGELEAIKAEMDNIVGLQKIKEYIFSLEEYYAVQKRREEEGLKTGEVSKHMIFTGNPGTGKTTIARIISRYLKAIGVLSGGQLVEVTRADLVGRYVGHTAPLTNQVLQSAIGGVLFIDEAYSLYRGKDDSFGLEAIDTLVKGIEDNRDNLVVILAGYSDEMSVFLTSNSGLKSRFPNVIEFPDYTGQELLEIAKITARSKGYELDKDAEPMLLAYFNLVQAIRARTAGNGRLVRNKVEEAILNQSRRLVAEPDTKELSLLTVKDFDLTDAEG